MAQAQAGAVAIRAAKDSLRKRLKKALAALSDQEKLEQSKNLVRMVARILIHTSCPHNATFIS